MSKIFCKNRSFIRRSSVLDSWQCRGSTQVYYTNANEGNTIAFNYYGNSASNNSTMTILHIFKSIYSASAWKGTNNSGVSYGGTGSSSVKA